MKNLFRLGYSAIITTMFVIANHIGEGLLQPTLRIIGSLEVLELIVLHYLWGAKARQMELIQAENIMDKQKISEFSKAFLFGLFIALSVLVIFFVPSYIEVGWIWVLSYSTCFFIIYQFTAHYLTIRRSHPLLRYREKLTLLFQSPGKSHIDKYNGK